VVKAKKGQRPYKVTGKQRFVINRNKGEKEPRSIKEVGEKQRVNKQNIGSHFLSKLHKSQVKERTGGERIRDEGGKKIIIACKRETSQSVRKPLYL